MPSPLTSSGPMFCHSSTASLPSSSIGTWTVGEDVDPDENRGWPLPWTGRGNREGGLSSNVPVQGRSVSLLFEGPKGFSVIRLSP